MSESGTSTGSRVVKVAAGLESTDRRVPVRDVRHEALSVLIGKWINEGHTVATPGQAIKPESAFRRDDRPFSESVDPDQKALSFPGLSSGPPANGRDELS